MNRQVLFLVAWLFCMSFIEDTYAAELITLRYGQNAASADSLSSRPDRARSLVAR
jgi:hypothetical protein